MRRVLRMQLWLAMGVLACAAPARAAAPASPAFSPIAHSSLVTLEGARTASGLELRLRRPQGDAALPLTGLTVSIDGRSAAATAAADGTWLVPWPGGSAPATGRLDVVVGHDGIRELLSGPLPGAAAGAGGDGGAVGAGNTSGGGSTSGTGGGRDHKQLLWWILNIGIVLIAVLAISRRMS